MEINLRNEIKAIVKEVIAEELTGRKIEDDQRERDDNEKQRGRVAHPEQDRRLKMNRSKSI